MTSRLNQAMRGKERRTVGEEEERATTAKRPRVRRENHKNIGPKWQVYIGMGSWGKGREAPGLRGLGQR